jgi:hypothetical protein
MVAFIVWTRKRMTNVPAGTKLLEFRNRIFGEEQTTKQNTKTQSDFEVAHNIKKIPMTQS